MFYKESKNLLNQKEINFIKDIILGNSFPWYYHQASTTKECPVYTHTLIHRYNINEEKPVINSNVFSFFEKIILKFCKKHGIKIKTFTRATLNSISFNKKKKVVAHVDHNFKHKVIMIYLNNTDGETIVYDKRFDNKNSLLLSHKMKILKTIKPELYKIVCWDGSYYHAATYPKDNNRRVVFVATFI
mgnify:FL=1